MPMINYKNSSTIARRLNAIKSAIDTTDLRIIEFGALDRPTFIRPDHNVYYVDYSSQEDIASKSADNRRKFDDVVPVDFPLKLGSLSNQTSGPYDLFVANHVIEHIPNMIGWLLEIESLASPDAFLSLIVPDKRNTFDFQRENTDLIELIRNFDEKLTQPSAYQVMRHNYYHRHLKHKSKGDFQPYISLAEATQMGKRAAHEYIDTHCNVFTRESFIDVVQQLHAGNIIKWKVHTCKEIAADSSEFHIILQL